jgi:hypothetical protein
VEERWNCNDAETEHAEEIEDTFRPSIECISLLEEARAVDIAISYDKFSFSPQASEAPGEAHFPSHNDVGRFGAFEANEKHECLDLAF